MPATRSQGLKKGAVAATTRKGAAKATPTATATRTVKTKAASSRAMQTRARRQAAPAATQEVRVTRTRGQGGRRTSASAEARVAAATQTSPQPAAGRSAGISLGNKTMVLSLEKLDHRLVREAQEPAPAAVARAEPSPRVLGEQARQVQVRNNAVATVRVPASVARAQVNVRSGTRARGARIANIQIANLRAGLFAQPGLVSRTANNEYIITPQPAAPVEVGRRIRTRASAQATNSKATSKKKA